MKGSSEAIYYAELDSKVGPITLATTDKGICWLDFGSNEKTLNQLKIWAKKWANIDQIIKSENKLDEAKKQLTEYFYKERIEFDLRIDLYGTPFQKIVWEELLKIPYGEVRSYKDIAISINDAKSVRAIGNANHNNPIPIIIPCHRVIGSNGNLIGYGGGIKIKQFLLDLEGYKNLKSV